MASEGCRAIDEELEQYVYSNGRGKGDGLERCMVTEFECMSNAVPSRCRRMDCVMVMDWSDVW